MLLKRYINKGTTRSIFERIEVIPAYVLRVPLVPEESQWSIEIN